MHNLQQNGYRFLWQVEQLGDMLEEVRGVAGSESESSHRTSRGTPCCETPWRFCHIEDVDMFCPFWKGESHDMP